MRVIAWFVSGCVVVASLAAAQGPPPDIDLTGDDKRDLIELLARKIDNLYVDEALAGEIAGALRDDLGRGVFDPPTSALELVPLVNRRLDEHSGDPHLRLGYSFEPQDPEDDVETEAEYAERVSAAARNGYGITRVEHLAGNIGLLRIERFHHPSFAGEAVTAAMTLLHDTYGLIVDLRGSRGGAPEMVAFLLSHFVGHEPVHYADTYFRPNDEIVQRWTEAHVPAGRYGAKPVLLLIDGGTYSASEAFAFYMRRLDRARLVGSRSRGGARMGRYYGLTPHFAVYVSVGRLIGPGEVDDWEGTGLAPDTEVVADEAELEAHRMLLDELLEGAASDELREFLTWSRSQLPAGSTSSVG